MATGIGAALRYPFQSEKKWMNLLLGMVCFFIPIVGPIVFMGYTVLIERAVIENPESGPPDFDLGKFTAHLKRGVPGFVASLIALLGCFALMVPIVILFVLAGVFLGQKSEVAVLVIATIGVVTYFGLMLAMMSFVTPIVMRAGLEQSIMVGFKPAFLREYFKKVGGLTLYYAAILMALSFFMIFGYCLLVIGIYLTFAYWMMVQSHVRAQLYRAYVERGGTPFVIAKDEVPPGFAPVMRQPG